MEQLIVSIGPHLKDAISTKRIMWAVTASLVPAGAASVFIFGLNSLLVIIASVFAAVATEAVILALRRKDVRAVYDGSAVLTGLLLAYNIPPGSPVWMPLAGSFFAIAIGKQVFGGLGYNVLNPALAARAFLMASWPVQMTTTWLATRGGALSGTALRGVDVLTQATPLAVWKKASQIVADPAATTHQIVQARQAMAELSSPDATMNLFLGNVGGCIGETSALLLLIGAAYLMFKRWIGWRIPVSYILTVAFLAWAFGGVDGLFTGNAVFHVLAGGLILGAFYMATDMVTSPVSPAGMVVFGAGCGLLTTIIRLAGGYPEGVCYSILIMNVATPLIDRTTRPKRLGEVRKRA